MSDEQWVPIEATSNGWKASYTILLFDAFVQPREKPRNTIDRRKYRMSPVEVIKLNRDE